MPRPRIQHKLKDGHWTKYCHTCDTWQSVYNFGYSKKAWDSYYTKCNECIKRYNQRKVKQCTVLKRFYLHREYKSQLCEYCQTKKNLFIVNTLTICEQCFYCSYIDM